MRAEGTLFGLAAVVRYCCHWTNPIGGASIDMVWATVTPALGLCAVFCNAVLCGTKVTAFNPFAARVVSRVGTLRWSCEDFLLPNFFWPVVWQSSDSLMPVEKEDEDDVDRIVLRVPL